MEGRGGSGERGEAAAGSAQRQKSEGDDGAAAEEQQQRGRLPRPSHALPRRIHCVLVFLRFVLCVQRRSGVEGVRGQLRTTVPAAQICRFAFSLVFVCIEYRGGHEPQRDHVTGRRGCDALGGWSAEGGIVEQRTNASRSQSARRVSVVESLPNRFATLSSPAVHVSRLRLVCSPPSLSCALRSLLHSLPPPRCWEP